MAAVTKGGVRMWTNRQVEDSYLTVNEARGAVGLPPLPDPVPKLTMVSGTLTGDLGLVEVGDRVEIRGDLYEVVEVRDDSSMDVRRVKAVEAMSFPVDVSQDDFEAEVDPEPEHHGTIDEEAGW